MLDELRSLLQTVAPLIATALGSPLAGGAVAVLSNLLLGKATGSQEEVLKAISQATPDIWLKIKKAEQQFQLDMAKLGLDKDKLDEMRIQDARQREVDMAKAGKRDLTTPILCFCFTIAFFGMMILMFFFPVQPTMKEVANNFVGSLITAELMILSYYFGSSSGSREKDAIIAIHANTESKPK